MEKIFYLASIFEGLKALVTVLEILGGVVIVVLGFMYFQAKVNNNCTKEDDKLMKKILRPTIIIVVVSVLVDIFVPGRKTYLLMSAGRIVDKAAENDPKVKDIPENTIQLLGSFLQSELQKLEDNKNNEEDNNK